VALPLDKKLSVHICPSMGPTVDLDTVEERQASCFCKGPNINFSVVYMWFARPFHGGTRDSKMEGRNTVRNIFKISQNLFIWDNGVIHVLGPLGRLLEFVLVAEWRLGQVEG
jgi:hypothetical protein